MRLAFFSPLPPAKSGIADYSAALLDALTKNVEVEVYTREQPDFDPAGFDGIIYQLGNNPYHSFVYEQALKAPGIVVMHEANLHHLIADITIRRGDWDAYMREVEYDGGAAALAFAQRVRRLEVGPDYEGVPMLRRVLECSRGAIAHSRFVAAQLRATGYRGPIAVIPHGAWLTDADRTASRSKLGISDETPLIGIFGFLKPYKRIPESLRAFRRLLAVHPVVLEHAQRGRADLGDRGIVGGHGHVLARRTAVARERDRDALRELGPVGLRAPEPIDRIDARGAAGRGRRLDREGWIARGERDQHQPFHGTTSTSSVVFTSPSATVTVVLPGARARRRRRSSEPSGSTASA